MGMAKVTNLGFLPDTEIELGFGAEKWDASRLTDEEKEEIRAYAAERGFRIDTKEGIQDGDKLCRIRGRLPDGRVTLRWPDGAEKVVTQAEAEEIMGLRSGFWMSWAEDAATRYPGVGERFQAWAEPLAYDHWAGFGTLTLADFVAYRSPGWKETAANMVACIEAAIGMTEDERTQSLAKVSNLNGKIAERERESFREAYAKAAEYRLKEGTDLIADEHIPALEIRVRELRRELELVGNILIDKFGERVLDWLRVAKALVADYRRSITPEEGLESNADHHERVLHADFQLGQAPALTFNHGEYLLRHELRLPNAIVRAQLSGLAYLLLQREPYIVEATHLRDKLDTYENLLIYAIRDEPPLGEEAMARLEKVREKKPAKVFQLSNDKMRLKYIDEVLYPMHFNSGGWPAIANAFKAEWADAGLAEEDRPYGGANPDEMNRKHRQYRLRLRVRATP